MEKTVYVVKCITEDSYLRRNASKYGTSLNLSNFDHAEHYPSIDFARDDILGYCKKTKSKAPKMFEILETKIVTSDSNSISPFPSELHIAAYEFATEPGLVPSLEELKKISKEEIETLLKNRYSQTPKSFEFTVEEKAYTEYEIVTNTPYTYAILTNIVW